MVGTKGPWRVVSGAIVGPGGVRIGGADRSEKRVSPVERDENVRLMGAARELLSQLEELHRYLVNISAYMRVEEDGYMRAEFYAPLLQQHIARSGEAIAKAKGGEA